MRLALPYKLSAIKRTYCTGRVDFENGDLHTPTSPTELSAQWNELTVARLRSIPGSGNFQNGRLALTCRGRHAVVRPIKLTDDRIGPGAGRGQSAYQPYKMSTKLLTPSGRHCPNSSFICFQYGFCWSLSPSYCQPHLYIGYWAFLLLQLLTGTSRS